jgi:creatinine amidohydrolase/Fe(II)-dependent formamide hydrolase-like protein/sterol desaturase/sphingolipid hydroxylase (fatty acid hydroxylase superfamily)
MDIQDIALKTMDEWSSLVNPGARIFVLYLMSAALIAFCVYRRVESLHKEEDAELGLYQDRPEKPLGFLSYLLDRDVLNHPSTKQDLIYFLVNAFVYAGIISQFLISTHVITGYAYDGLTELLGTGDFPFINNSWAILTYTIVSILIFDFAVFLTHWMMHKIPVLWEFHKVHHSAEMLNPLTLFRMHPLDLFITATVASLFNGFGVAGLFYLTKQAPQELTMFGINIVLALFYFFGYNLRHSHIWLNYPAWLSHILVSPAQHQVHHSSDPKHWNRNMGLIFSFWDKLFHTLYIPRGYEKLSFGLSAVEPNPFKTVTEFYYKPFVRAYEQLCKNAPTRRGKAFLAGVLSLGLAGYAALFAVSANATLWNKPDSVMLEDLTWVEVKNALDNGTDTIIIPTGGTEQNGPYIPLGKHNVIVRETSSEIAKRIGNALVTPVMAYVPEGSIEPKGGHMAFAGTISLSDAVFESVIEATARSMRAHGFKHIFLIADSGDSQPAQKEIAAKLDAEWKTEGVRVANIDQYYFANKQKETLLVKGFTETQIGRHAGMRETSELLYLYPQYVRITPVEIPNGMIKGSDGDMGSVSAELGKQLIALKIDAGVRQIEALRAQFAKEPAVGPKTAGKVDAVETSAVK